MVHRASAQVHVPLPEPPPFLPSAIDFSSCQIAAVVVVGVRWRGTFHTIGVAAPIPMAALPIAANAEKSVGRIVYPLAIVVRPIAAAVVAAHSQNFGLDILSVRNC